MDETPKEKINLDDYFNEYTKSVRQKYESEKNAFVDKYLQYANDFFKGCPENIIVYSNSIALIFSSRYYYINNVNVPVVPEVFNSFESYIKIEKNSCNGVLKSEFEKLVSAIEMFERVISVKDYTKVQEQYRKNEKNYCMGTLVQYMPEKTEEEHSEFLDTLREIAKDDGSKSIDFISEFLKKDFSHLVEIACGLSGTEENTASVTTDKTVEETNAETETPAEPADEPTAEAIEEESAVAEEEVVTDEPIAQEDVPDCVIEPSEAVSAETEESADDIDDEVNTSVEDEKEDFALAAEGDQLCFEF